MSSHSNLTFLSFLIIISSVLCEIPQKNSVKLPEDEFGQPLFLTPLIENGKFEEARKAAEVPSELFFNVTSYSGFFTVNKTFNKNLYSWFVPSKNDNDPVMLWLQGGPGLTSIFGLLAEIGPFGVENDTLFLRNYSWTDRHSILFVDNPAGTGYSFTNEGGLNHDEHQIGEELYVLLKQFFKLFPNLKKNKFVIAGESYAGKYVPVISYTVYKKNLDLPDSEKINLQALAIGNGWLDPINQMNVGEYVFQHGLVDRKTQKIIDNLRDQSIQLLNQSKFIESTKVQRNITKVLKEASGFQNLYNYLYPAHQETENIVTSFVQKTEIRKALHVGNLTFNSDTPVDTALLGDIMISVADLLSELLDNFKVLIYSGQLDLAVPYPTTVDYLEKLNFSSAEEYKNAHRSIWYEDNEIYGYYKIAGNLTELLILNAGHLVPKDKPIVAYEMINHFTHDN